MAYAGDLKSNSDDFSSPLFFAEPPKYEYLACGDLVESYAVPQPLLES
jgi:hypothetical protein